MKRLVIFCISVLSFVYASAQGPFKGKFFNEEHEIFLVVNLYDKNVTVPGQEIYGEMDGYVGSRRTSLVWMITSSHIKEGIKAEIEIVNDYGSEDAEAELTIIDENTIIYSRKSGSNLRFSKNGKWVRMPSKITFTRNKK